MKYLLFLLLSSSLAFAGLEMKMSTKALDGGDDRNEVVTLGKGSMRVDFTGGDVSTIIYKKDTMYMLNHADKTYRKITKSDMKKMKKKADDAQSQMKAQMAKMPAAQRAMMKKMMGSMGGASFSKKPPKPVYKKIASGTKVGSYKCNKYSITAGGSKTNETCYSSWKSLGIKPADFKIMKKVSSFATAFSSSKQANTSSFGGGSKGMPDGFPVQDLSYNDGSKSALRVLNSINRKDFPTSHFVVPKGYKWQKNNF